MKSWFSTWFDSKYYPILYQHRNDEEAKKFIDHLLEFLPKKDHADWLDLACGNGRHAIYLAKKGFKVTGLDLSPNAIQHAKNTSNELGLNVEFDVHDMRQSLSPKQFDFIFNLFTSFGYFSSQEEEIETLQSINHALRTPSSYLVIDFLNARKVIDGIVPRETKVINEIEFKLKRYVKNKKVIKEIQINDHGRSSQFEESVNLLFEEDFKFLFDQVGLNVKHTFGNYYLDPFDIKTSDRLIMICQKNA